MAERWLPGRLAERLQPLAARLERLMSGADSAAAAQRMAITAYVMRIASAVIAFGMQVVLARWMGGFEYGIFVVVWTAVTIVGVLSGLGLETCVVRLAAAFHATGAWAPLRGLFVASRGLGLISGSIVAGLGLASVWLLGDHVSPYYVAPIALGAVCLPLYVLTDVQDGMARALGWTQLALAPTFLWRPIAILVLASAAFLAGLPMTAVTVCGAAIVATWATGVAQWLVIARRFAREVPPARAEYRLRPWFGMTLSILLVDGFMMALTGSDVLIVSQFESPERVAVYFAAAKILALVHFVYFAVKSASAQRFAAVQLTGDRQAVGAVVREAVNWTFWPSLVVAGAVLLFGRLLLQLFGRDFVDGYGLIAILLVGVLARASVGPAEALLTMGGRQKVSATVYGFAFAGNVMLNFALVPWLGIWGAALGTSAVMVGESLALYIAAKHYLGVHMFIVQGAPVRPLQAQPAE